jgi:antitoxin ParD1/3/4
MEKEAERLYVFKELLKSVDDIENGRTFSADEVEQNMDNYLNEGEQ